MRSAPQVARRPPTTERPYHSEQAMWLHPHQRGNREILPDTVASGGIPAEHTHQDAVSAAPTPRS